MAEEADAIAEAYRAATRQWADVTWPEPAFRAHLSVVEPAASADLNELFLSGAAAFHSSEAWVAIGGLCREALMRSLAIEYGLEGDDATECWHDVYIRMSAEDTAFPAKSFKQLGFDRAPGKLIRFRGSSKLETYLKQIARNATLDLLRKRRAERRRDEKYGAYAHRVRDGGEGSVIDAESGRRLYDAIRRASAAFDDDAKRLFLYVHIHGMTRRDASALLGWPDPSKATRRLQAMERAFANEIADALPSGPEGVDPSTAQSIFARAVQSTARAASGVPEKDVVDECPRESQEV